MNYVTSTICFFTKYVHHSCIVLFVFLASCSSSKVFQVPYDDMVAKVKTKYGKADKEKRSSTVVENLRVIEVPEIPSNGSMINFIEGNNVLSFELARRYYLSTSRYKIPMWYQITLRKVDLHSTEVEIYSEDRNVGRYGCCCFLLFNMGQRNVSGERRVLKEIEALVGGNNEK